MADSFSSLLRFRLQQTGGNNNTWGGLLNTAAIQLIEDAIAGTAEITVAGSDVTLTTANGANDQGREAILHLTGAPGAPRNIVVPALSKVYVVKNDTGQVMTIKTAVASSDTVAVAAGVITLVTCSGVDGDIAEVSPQNSSFATNAAQLGGVDAAYYARLNLRQTFSKPQMYLPVPMTMAATVTPDMSLGNFFTGVLTTNTTIGLPTSIDATAAHPFQMIISQASAGGPYTAVFDSFFDFLGQTPSMPSTAGAILYVRGVIIPALGKAICVSQAESASTVSDQTFASNEDNIDVFRRLGSPAGIVNVTITVGQGVVIGSKSALEPAMDFSGGFASGSTINLVNLGYIVGRGGRGANGNYTWDSGDSEGAIGYGIGGAGGNAIRAPGVGITFNITNASGRIWGGGGGGGAGGVSADDDGHAGSGGAGGGAGCGEGGRGVNAKLRPNTLPILSGDGVNGALKLDGSAAGGAAGSGAQGGTATAGTSGAGGDYGAAGTAGTSNTTHPGMQLAATTGGAAGKAVDLTGASPTFVNGSGSPNVKGLVA